VNLEQMPDDAVLLVGIGENYRNTFRNYRNQYGQLDSDIWLKDFDTDYVLEILQTTLAMVNFLCELMLKKTMTNDSYDSSFADDVMADYDIGYSVFEDCMAILSVSENSSLMARDSLIVEIFYSHIQYFNISNSAGRQGWLDVNKRLLGSLTYLVSLKPSLIELIDEWGEDVEDLDESDFSFEDSPDQSRWKQEFLKALLESLESLKGKSKT
jgi:hypothetical protein